MNRGEEVEAARRSVRPMYGEEARAVGKLLHKIKADGRDPDSLATEEEEYEIRDGRRLYKSKKCTECGGDGKRWEFRCPKCGGSHFGSTFPSSFTGPLFRKCGTCGFAWADRFDHRYFHKTDAECPICLGTGHYTTFTGEPSKEDK